ncbi:cytochrome c oxidase subunit II [Myxosarcina sp. GI1]|uniref:cytochrome c oxidase subunit II n=1 Tax=Myxosarcina sp. GI1 TaxID=1541065 RepID=UPI0005614633|nr:cytochrome c oxidase subunit II [Myxosarcina sp. GI1]
MPKFFEYILMAVGMVIIILVSYWLGQQAYTWMPIEASTDAKHIDDLFSFLVTMAAVIFFGVIGMLVYSLIFYRAKSGDYTEGHAYRHNWKIEVVWLVIPTALVLWIGIYSMNIYTRMEIAGPDRLLADSEPAYIEVIDRNNSNTPTTIEVVAKQWAWDFRYLNTDISSNELHLPVNRRVRLLLQSEDVLHGFYVPEFRIKQDIIPSRTITFQFIPNRVGKYKLHDSQLSGTYFATMEADVYVDTAEDYQKWLTEIHEDRTLTANLAVSEHARSPKKVFNSHYPTVIPTQTDTITASDR